jgi:hypothetical protein
MEPIAKTMRHRNRFSFRGTAIAGLVTAGALALTHAAVQGQTRVGGEALQELLQNPNSFKWYSHIPGSVLLVQRSTRSVHPNRCLGR